MRREGLCRLPTIVLEDMVRQLHAAICALMRMLLAVIAVLDERGAHAEDGATDMGTWLAGQLHIDRWTGRRWAETAYRLRDLPRIADAFAEGELSLEQLAPLTRFATPQSDAELARRAPFWSPAQLRRMARRASPPTEPVELDPWFQVRWAGDRRTAKLAGELPGEDAGIVFESLARVCERRRGRGRDEDGFRIPTEREQAEALVELASMRLASDPDPDRATLVVHVDTAAGTGEKQVAVTEHGTILAPAVLERLACDARLQVVGEEDGEARSIGAVDRTVPPWLRRVVLHRDGSSCRFPGCDARRWLHVHHIVHWADGGPTEMTNLVTLCGYHHRLIHREGWKITGHPGDTLRFHRHDGQVLPARRPALDLRLRAKLARLDPRAGPHGRGD